jgi:hypothetical protein
MIDAARESGDTIVVHDEAHPPEGDGGQEP